MSENARLRLLSVRELREAVGPDLLGRDLAYRLARRYGVRLGRRLLIPSRVVEALLKGELELAPEVVREGADAR